MTAAKTAPGLALTAGAALLAYALAFTQQALLAQVVVEPLVAAILVGMVARTAWTPPERFTPGIDLAAKELLEVAIVLLGASVDLPLLVQAGPRLALGIVTLVVLGLALGYGIGRALGLPHPLAVLVASGNAICGNSAIAAIAPVIHAGREHVASAIAFTAILGVAVVLGLPHLAQPLGLDDFQYGVLAGLTVYAVPQVLAAAFPVSTLAGQVGTLVKLVRVLMLGPVVLFFTVTHRGALAPADRAAFGARRGRALLPLAGAVPWFIIGFLVLAGLRSTGIVGASLAGASKTLSTVLTVLAMAALGLGVDLRAVARVGPRVAATVTLSLVVLVALAVALIRGLAIG